MPIIFLLLLIFTSSPAMGDPVVASSPTSSYAEQYFFETVQFESGTAYFVFDRETISSFPVPLNSLLSVGTVIQTPADKLAQIRLGCGSFFRLAPNTRLIIGTDSFELAKGSILVQHVSSQGLLKVSGPSLVEIFPETLLEIESKNNRFLMRVQVGQIRSPNSLQIFTAPEKIEASGQTWKSADSGPEIRAWDEPSISPVERKLTLIPEDAESDLSWSTIFSEAPLAGESAPSPLPAKSGDNSEPPPDQGQKNFLPTDKNIPQIKNAPPKIPNPDGDPDLLPRDANPPAKPLDNNRWPTSLDGSPQ